jgi:hypothetical protein
MAKFDPIDIVFQTTYSELVQRALDADFASEFSLDGRFVAVDIKGQKYWYFDIRSPDGGPQKRRYVGPVHDEEITKRVEAFKDLKSDAKRRRRMVATLVREAYLPQPPTITGRVVAELANAGFFRLRGVLVGTVAYQCYSAVLGRRLDASAMQTGDADFAQFREISVAIEDSLPPILDVLRKVDPTFREIPSQADSRVSTQFTSRESFKVEFLTPNRGSDDIADKPVKMPALGGASAFPLRFLDFLIRHPIRSVLLHGPGIPVLVPSPERYAVHKLIVASRRIKDSDVSAKSRKDRLQARSIFEAMIANQQQGELAAAYAEAWDRGESWREAINKSMATYDETFRDLARQALNQGIIENGDDPSKYDLSSEVASSEASP